MLELAIGVLIGMLAMDALWAWKLGIPQAMYYRWKSRNNKSVDNLDA